MKVELKDVINEYMDEMNRLRESNREMLNALQITQQVCSGSFAEGWTILVTGHQMNAIRDAIWRASRK